jgi:hypothetical protein
MLSRNFYVVLGVPANESSGGIRRAYRELALRYHPDRAGAQGTPSFQELTEASMAARSSSRLDLPCDRRATPSRSPSCRVGYHSFATSG